MTRSLTACLSALAVGPLYYNGLQGGWWPRDRLRHHHLTNIQQLRDQFGYAVIKGEQATITKSGRAAHEALLALAQKHVTV